MIKNDPIMLDLETLGNSSNSVIIAIGAVRFDPSEMKITDEFYMNIDPESCVQAGLKIDASTVMWWMQQDVKARNAFKVNGTHMIQALAAYSQWAKDVAHWGNGSDFDCTILINAYKSIGMEPPWKFWNNRCYRTMKNQYPQVSFDRKGTHHNALDDAKSQAMHLMKILNHIRG